MLEKAASGALKSNSRQFGSVAKRNVNRATQLQSTQLLIFSIAIALNVRFRAMMLSFETLKDAERSEG